MFANDICIPQHLLEQNVRGELVSLGVTWDATLQPIRRTHKR